MIGPDPLWSVERSRHRKDTFFLETVDVLGRLGVEAGAFAHRHAVLLLKPDAAVLGGMGVSVQWLADHGYRVVVARTVQLTRLHLRALWYFNWHLASAERRALADELAGLSPSIVLIARHRDGGGPAASRLTADKGPADPAERVPGQLRHALGGDTYLLNQVHSPDDPDDVLRELSVYFDEAELSDVVRECQQGRDRGPSAARLAREVESKVRRRIDGLEGAEQELLPLIEDLVGAAPRTQEQWREALWALRARGAPVDPWSRMVVEAARLPMRRPHGPEQRWSEDFSRL